MPLAIWISYNFCFLSNGQCLCLSCFAILSSQMANFCVTTSIISRLWGHQKHLQLLAYELFHKIFIKSWQQSFWLLFWLKLKFQDRMAFSFCMYFSESENYYSLHNSYSFYHYISGEVQEPFFSPKFLFYTQTYNPIGTIIHHYDFIHLMLLF